MKYEDIAKKAKPPVSTMAVSLVVRGGKTRNIALAKAVAKFTGKRPIDYINSDIKDGLGKRTIAALSKKY